MIAGRFEFTLSETSTFVGYGKNFYFDSSGANLPTDTATSRPAVVYILTNTDNSPMRLFPSLSCLDFPFPSYSGVDGVNIFESASVS